MNPNISQLIQNITKHLSLASIGLGVFNTITNQTTIKSLRNSLEIERDKNSKLVEEVNKLFTDNKIEEAIKKNLEINELNNNKLELLNNKINNMIENKKYDEPSVSEVHDSMKEINNELIEIIKKIDDSLINNFIGDGILKIFNDMQAFYSNLNYFQCLALTHLSAIVFIFLSLISLVSLYFGDYLIYKLNIEKYPKIFKFINIRRKFQRFYLIKDLIIIFITLILLTYINIMLYINFTL